MGEEEHPTKIRPFSRPFVEINLTPISFWTDGRFVFHVQTKKASRFPFFFFFPLSAIVRRPTTLAWHIRCRWREHVYHDEFSYALADAALWIFPRNIYIYILLHVRHLFFCTRSRTYECSHQYAIFFLDLIAFCTNFITVPRIQKIPVRKIYSTKNSLQFLTSIEFIKRYFNPSFESTIIASFIKRSVGRQMRNTGHKAGD